MGTFDLKAREACYCTCINLLELCFVDSSWRSIAALHLVLVMCSCNLFVFMVNVIVFFLLFEIKAEQIDFTISGLCKDGALKMFSESFYKAL